MTLTRILLIFTLLFSTGCISNPFNKKEDQKKEIKAPKEKKKRAVYNVREKINSQESGIIFGGKKEDPFGKQNVMWLATLEVLDFLPIVSADYNGGTIATDWYSDGKSNESIKINVNFTSNEVKTSSFNIKAFKKVCSNTNACKVVKMNQGFNRKIKEQILEEVKRISLEKEEKKG